tara:strand:- start:385 stop:1308 length:924 start_codon:yes stop_codon:yes gene_type:complete
MSHNSNQLRIPHYEKVFIGPLTILGEMVFGGHYIETLKIMKQSSKSTYPSIMKSIWSTYKMKGFYLGFWPWSFIQTTKGLPVLFVQAETKHMFQTTTSLSSSQSQLLSGIIGGMSQGVFVTPTQRMKTIVMTKTQTKKSVEEIRRQSSFHLIKKMYHKEGLRTFFTGLTPMMMRRGIDWGIRFYCFQWIQDTILTYKNRNRNKNKNNSNQDIQNKNYSKLNFFDTIISSIGAGFCATITTPIDTCIAESQKYSHSGKKKSLLTLVNHIYKNYGYRGFVRGWSVRVLHSCYHTVWVCGVGNILFSHIR